MEREFYLSDDKFLKPCYRISPFTTKDLAENSCLNFDDSILKFLNNKFSSKNFIFTNTGREALSIALRFYSLKKDDVVTIFTTSGNYYVSSCVTNEIEKYCSWSRNIEKKTKILLIIHEFGFPYENLRDLKKYNFPIIEDCAHSFGSQNKENSVGKVGDFVIYSLPKFFSINFGGILFSKKNKLYNFVDSNKENYIIKVLSKNIKNYDQIIEKRVMNYNYLESQMQKKFNYEIRFKLEKNYVPGVFLVRIDDINLNKLKTFFQNNGVEASVFYNEKTFFMPVHQALKESDLDYFIYLIYEFKRREVF